MLRRMENEIKLLLVILLIPFIAMGYFIFYENIKLKIEDEKKKNTELAKVTAYYLDTYFRSVKYSLKALDDRAINVLDRSQIQQFFRNYNKLNEVEAYFVLDKKGRLIDQYPQGNQLTESMFRPRSMPESTDPIIELVDPFKDPVRVRITVAIRNDDGYVQGYVGAIMSMSKIAREFANIKVSNNGYVIMIDTDGHVLVHPNPARLRQLIPKEQMQSDPIYRAAYHNKLGAIDIVAPYDGKRKLFAYAHLQEINWIVLLVEPETDLDVLTTQLITRNLAIFALVGGTVLILLRYLQLLRKRKIEQEAIRSEKLALVGQLAAGMAHEIRNPLTAIKGFLQMMLGSQTSEINRRWLHIMLTETEQIERIITETLLLAKPQKQKIVEFDLVQQVQQIIPVLEAEAALLNVQLKYVKSYYPLVIKGDVNHFKQALINIIKNALEASPTGDEVVVTVKRSHRRAIIEVGDNGKGIDIESMNKVGTPFYTTKETGTGLGLMVTLRIIEDMGGKLTINSQLGVGTKVTVELPIVVDKHRGNS